MTWYYSLNQAKNKAYWPNMVFLEKVRRINYDLDIYQLHCTCAKLDKTSTDNLSRIFYVIL